MLVKAMLAEPPVITAQSKVNTAMVSSEYRFRL